MSNVQVYNGSNNVLVDHQQVICRTKDLWVDSWADNERLIPIAVEQIASPGISTATCQFLFGEVKYENDANFRTYSALNLYGKYLQIQLLSTEGDRTTIFSGVIESDNSVGNTQTISASGMELVLDRIPIIGSFFTDGSGEHFVTSIPEFNKTSSSGESLDGNRTALPNEDGIFTFATTNGVQWSNLDVLNYILNKYTGSLNVVVKGNFDSLANIFQVQRFENLTLKQCIDHLIDRRNGLLWHCYVDGNDDIVVSIHSLFEEDLPIGELVIQGNKEVISLSFDDTLLSDVSVIQTQNNQYDAVLIIGDKIQVTATLKVSDGSLIKGWTSDEEDAYKVGDADFPVDAIKCDNERQTEKYNRVYQFLRVNPDWNWITSWWDTVTSSFKFENASPGMTSLGLNPTLEVPVYYPGVKALRQLPLKNSSVLDYTDYIKPLILVQQNDVFIQVDNSLQDPVTSCASTVVMSNQSLGFFIKPRINHIFGAGEFENDNLIDNYIPDSAAGWTLTNMIFENNSFTRPISFFNGKMEYVITGLADDTKYRIAFRLNHPENQFYQGQVTSTLCGVIGGITPEDSTGFYFVDVKIGAVGDATLKLETDDGFIGAVSLISVSILIPSTKIQPTASWKNIWATLNFQMTERIRYFCSTESYTEKEFPRTLIIDYPEAQMHYIVPKTVLSVFNGVPIATIAGGIVKSDFETIKQIAEMSLAWYGKTRSAISLQYAAITTMPSIGSYVKSIAGGNNYNRRDVGTVITRKTYDFENGSSGLNTDYIDIDVRQMTNDFPRLSGFRAVSVEIRRLRNEITNLQRQVSDIPIRIAFSGGSGQSDSSFFTFADQPPHDHSDTPSGGWLIGSKI